MLADWLIPHLPPLIRDMDTVGRIIQVKIAGSIDDRSNPGQCDSSHPNSIAGGCRLSGVAPRFSRKGYLIHYAESLSPLGMDTMYIMEVCGLLLCMYQYFNVNAELQHIFMLSEPGRILTRYSGRQESRLGYSLDDACAMRYLHVYM